MLYVEEVKICPHCGFMVARFEPELARFDFYCPRCEEMFLSNFEYRQWWHEEEDKEQLNE